MTFLDIDYGELKYETIGKDIEYSPNPDGTIPKIKIRRAHGRHKGYASMVASAMKRIRGRDDQELEDVTMMEVYAKTIILGWSDIIVPPKLASEFGLQKGDRIPFNYENVVKLMKARRRWWDSIYQQAKQESFFEETEDEETVKN